MASLPPAFPALVAQALISHGRFESGFLRLTEDIPTMPSGVVCETWLQPDIRRKSLAPEVSSLGISAGGFVAEIARLCGYDAPVGTNYTGLWRDSHPTQADVQVLQGLTKWTKKQRDSGEMKKQTWQAYSKPDNGTGLAGLVRYVATHPTNLTVAAPMRILDFGCGSATDILAIKSLFAVKTEDTLCLDIFEVKNSEVTPFVLNASTDSAYQRSLESILGGNAATIHVAISMVTFHHIVQGQRRSAFSFLNRVLADGGIFIMADWDNSVLPDRTIYYDLEHILMGVVFSNSAPSMPDQLKLGTEYLSVDNWKREAQQAGLRYSASRSKLGGLGPRAQANRSISGNRDFNIVFERGL